MCQASNLMLVVVGPIRASAVCYSTDLAGIAPISLRINSENNVYRKVHYYVQSDVKPSEMYREPSTEDKNCIFNIQGKRHPSSYSSRVLRVFRL